MRRFRRRVLCEHCLLALSLLVATTASFSQEESAQDGSPAVEQDTREAARKRELSAEENPTARRSAEREEARMEAPTDQEVEQEELQEQAHERELSAEEDPMIERAHRFEEQRAAEEESQELDEGEGESARQEARQREQAADEDPSGVRRAARDAEREAAQDQQAEEELEEAKERELGAEKDPLGQERSDREEQREAAEAAEAAEAGGAAPRAAPEKDTKYAANVQHTPAEGTTGFDIYGSLRIRYRDQGGENELQDGSSRIGADLEWQFKQGSYLFGRYETGFNILAGVSDLVNPGENSGEESDNSFFSRLGYVGIDTPIVAAVIGKNWSTYYKVTSFTDRFMGTGGSASGTYNAQTDGGPTGTGRADGTVQSQIRIDFLPQRWFKSFDLNIQVQDGNPIPFTENIDYGTAVGVSAVMTTQKDFTVGVAYNVAMVDVDANPSLRSVGVDGNARAAVLGTRAFGDRWYAGLLVSRLENHETTDEGIYFDGWGSEFYGQYRLLDRLWLTGGYNILEPDSDQRLARDYRVKYAVVGLRYTFDDFRRMLYANIRYDDSINADGLPGSNVYTVGIRWDLSRLGWHASTLSDAPPPEAN